MNHLTHGTKFCQNRKSTAKFICLHVFCLLLFWKIAVKCIFLPEIPSVENFRLLVFMPIQDNMKF